MVLEENTFVNYRFDISRLSGGILPKKAEQTAMFAPARRKRG